MSRSIESSIGGAICRFQDQRITRFTDLITASMTALLTSFSQLDCTRQPGYAQAGASWSAPMGVAPSAGNASKLLEGTIDTSGRDSRPRIKTGAAVRLGRRTP